MTATLITATVAGFVLVIDPENKLNRYEKFESVDAGETLKKFNQWRREAVNHYNANLNNRDWEELLVASSTQYRLQDGTVETEEGFNLMDTTKVGDRHYKATCRCGATSWIKFPDYGQPAGHFLCADCNRGDNDFDDFTNYDGMQEREY